MSNYPYKYLFYVSENYAFSILRPLQQAIRQSGGEVAWFFEGNNINRDYIAANEKELTTVEAVIAYQARAVFAPGNLIPHFFPGVKTWVFHGFTSEKRKRDNTPYSTIVRPWFDLYCTLEPHLTHLYKTIAKEKDFFRVIETGWSKVDPLFPLSAQTKNKRPVILVASTFTPRYTLAPHLKETIAELSKNDQWQWMVTFHPKMAPEIVESYKAIQYSNLQFIETDDVISLLKMADILICDSSSIKSEFLVQGKPVIAFRVTPELPYLIHIEEPKALEAGIIKALTVDEQRQQAIDDYTKKIHPYFDGRSSYRVLQAVEDYLASSDKPLKKKPIGWVRKFKIRKKLDYWK